MNIIRRTKHWLGKRHLSQLHRLRFRFITGLTISIILAMAMWMIHTPRLATQPSLFKSSNPQVKLSSALNSSQPASNNSVSETLTLLNRQGVSTDTITDGDLIKLKIIRDELADEPLSVAYELDSEIPIAACTISKGGNSCETKPFTTLGWYWGATGQAQPSRHIFAKIESSLSATTEVKVAARPVVLVHGFVSDAIRAWSTYTKSDGFLSTLGLSGYAVGDGQFKGVMHTGDPKLPTLRTHRIAENAQALKQYIADLKQTTRAEQVDLVAHSMGGLISRYYIDRLMPERDIAQLIMLGTPHGGSDCASLPTSLGFYLPASLELQPTYLREIFNPQITHRRGVPFHLFAGTPIVEAFKSPCSDVPSDLAVGLDSVSVIGRSVAKLPYLHTDLTTSDQVFRDIVEPMLKQQPGQFVVEPDPALPAKAADLTQFTRLFTGHIAAGENREVTINLDQLTVASFALFDPTYSLTVRVRGASGKEIKLNPVKHGLIEVNDPSSIIHLGYGFSNPKPGAWKVTLATTDKTPSQGADYAIAAKVIGDTKLHAQMSQQLPKQNEAVKISGRFDLAGQSLNHVVIQATIHHPDGALEILPLRGSGSEKRVNWKPKHPGIYGIDLSAQATTGGSPIERTTFLTAEVQPPSSEGLISLTLIMILIVGWLFFAIDLLNWR